MMLRAGRTSSATPAGGSCRGRRFPAAARVALLVGMLVGCGGYAADVSAAHATGAFAFDREVRVVFEQYCYSCHGERMRGDLDLRPFTNEAAVLAARETFERVLVAVRNREMPPSNRPQPTDEERERFLGWLEVHLFPVDCERPDPGRVTLRRLNRAEYNNTIRDLLGVDFRPADDFPADDAGYGFDNIGDVLSLSPVLLEKYLRAAELILEQAIVDPVNASVAASGDAVTEVPQVRSLPASHQRIFFRRPDPDNPSPAARAILRRFAFRAYRRPVAPEELRRLMALFQVGQEQGESFEGSVKLALQAVLVSPHFLFRGELQPEPDDPQAVHRVNEFALASRLSYFLWSSMPDDRLLALARQGRLRDRWESQVRRMLRDPRSRALVDNFAGQWLQLRNLRIVSPDPGRFPEFDEALRQAMVRETELFFDHLIRRDRSVLDFLEADYTFVNERLARHYGLDRVAGDHFRQVNLAGTHRGGVLTQGSILTLTSNPTRTSPVKRGKWVLDNLLGTPPPPPPPDVPELESQGQLTGTLRQRLEQHRENPNCISCHERMDPIGFGLEHFDGVGAWRDRDGEESIDASGRLVSGETFEGIDELRRILARERRGDFVRCLTSKLLTYALGRGLEYYDVCAIDRIVEEVEAGDYRFSALVLGITRSAPFQMRRGDGDAAPGLAATP